MKGALHGVIKLSLSLTDCVIDSTTVYHDIMRKRRFFFLMGMDMEILLRDVENTGFFYPFLTEPGYFESKQQQLILNVYQEFKG